MKKQAILQSLQHIETALTTCQLWSEHPPKLQQLSSQVPFCADTLPFEQWLQWVFLPTLRELMGSPDFCGLPHPSDIHSMAAYVFQAYPQNTDPLLTLIKTLDSQLNQFTNPSIH